MTGVERSLSAIRDQLEEFRRLAFDSDFHHLTPRSQWSISQHVDHCLLVMKAAMERLHDPKPTSRKKTLVGHVILAIGWIPRGRGKAPELVRGTLRDPKEVVSAISEIERQTSTHPAAALANRNLRILKHPYFGGLTAEETLRFVAIHNRHHLKIIKDMVL